MLTIIQKTDEEIQSQVGQELRWDCRTETSPITVSVAGGVVTLEGPVKYYAIKHAAEEAAHRVAGVASVRNRLEVRTPYLDRRADCEVQEAITQAFAWNALIPDEQISVLVDNGIVSLLGTVDCISQREEAERAVINLLGVRGIVNKVAVKAQRLEAETVCADIKNSLDRQGVADAPQVIVDADDGAVWLTGTAPSWNQRCAVVSAAKFAPGVREVVDYLKVGVSA